MEKNERPAVIFATVKYFLNFYKEVSMILQESKKEPLEN